MVYHSLKNIQNYLFPGLCQLCEARIPHGRDFCRPCEHSLPRVDSACAICAGTLPRSATGSVCGRCQRDPPRYRQVVPALAYAGPVPGMIIGLKYQRRLHLAPLLGRQLALRVEAAATELPDLIVPVPLSTARLRRRGYNQALEIARPLARRLGIALNPYGVRRIRDTAPQADLPQKQRARNVRNAFAARGRSFEGLSIALVDDVMTTGHTVNAVSRCLLTAGAKSVYVWVVARA